MGIQGRDYMRDRSVLDGASIRADAAGAAWLTWILAAVFVLTWLLFAGSWGPGVHPRGALARAVQTDWLFWPDSVRGVPRYIQPFTTIWFHDAESVLHLVTTLGLLLAFGPRVERESGRLRLGGLVVGGALVSVLGAWAGTLIVARSDFVVLGATGGGFALAGAVAWRGAGVYATLLGRGPWLIRRMVGVALVLAVVCMGSVIGGRLVWTALPFVLGHAAALGFGCLLSPQTAGAASARPAVIKRRRKPRPARPEVSAPPSGDGVRARVDQLLEKIGNEGMDALTAEERTFLEDASRRF